MDKIVIKLADGNTFKGELVKIDESEIVIKDVKYKNVVSESKIHREVHVMKVHIVYYYIDE
ncbi:hypothetical protein IAI10_02510 [Clostridium sp. 19966]|uniref:hypothetical protein n=1 Tax=Clostridium sp. 19966 TaxID=2768166 RepID=UPI0028E02C71|nr:hypothetical protein [Clostridium sp. 19966]MDT8715531.1 hypothetical protein [Clostridium sp. 19966]